VIDMGNGQAGNSRRLHDKLRSLVKVDQWKGCTNSDITRDASGGRVLEHGGMEERASIAVR
jgi:hypothetical protein